MNWVEKFIPSCCSSRSGLPRNNSNKSSGITLSLPDISMNQESSNDKIELSLISQVSLYKNKEETKHSLKVLNKNRLREISESRRSTNNTITSLDTSAFKFGKNSSETLNCMICSAKAIGYCPLCPTSRYCKECYEEKHRIAMKSHKFIRYVTKNMKNSEINQLVKIKTLCE